MDRHGGRGRAPPHRRPTPDRPGQAPRPPSGNRARPHSTPCSAEPTPPCRRRARHRSPWRSLAPGLGRGPPWRTPHASRSRPIDGLHLPGGSDGPPRARPAPDGHDRLLRALPSPDGNDRRPGALPPRDRSDLPVRPASSCAGTGHRPERTDLPHDGNGPRSDRTCPPPDGTDPRPGPTSLPLQPTAASGRPAHRLRVPAGSGGGHRWAADPQLKVEGVGRPRPNEGGPPRATGGLALSAPSPPSDGRPPSGRAVSWRGS